jgi:protein TonB
LSGLALALGVNLVLLLVLMTLGIIPPPLPKGGAPLIVDLVPAPQAKQATKSVAEKTVSRPVPKPPKIVLPVKPTIVPPPLPPETEPPWIEMTKDQMAAAEVSHLPKASAGSTAGDSEQVGRGPNGEVLYAAEWARHPTDAELGGYLPKNAPDGFGLIACRTIPDNRVDDCMELDQTPGSRLASAVRQAAWQFRVRPPRKGGKPLIGSWVEIRIDYVTDDRGAGL